MAVTEYRVTGTAAKALRLAGHTYEEGDPVVYDLGETMEEAAMTIAKAIASGPMLRDVRLVARVIGDWEEVGRG